MLSEIRFSRHHRKPRVTDLADRLRYIDGEKARPLPDWARYLIRLGESVGAQAGDAESVMAVASIPVRTFAAVLTSTGVIVRRALDPGHGLSLDEHFRRVSSKKIGTAVTVTRGKLRYTGVFQGTEHRDGTSYLRVQLTGEGGGNETHSVPLHLADRVQLGSEPYELRNRRASQRASDPSPFLIDCLEEMPATKFVQRARTDCVLRGHLSLLESELRDQLFEVNVGRAGSLSQILRPKPIVPPGAPHRSIILKLRQSFTPIDPPEPPVLVFDGALSFLRHNGNIPSHSSIVLLDRSEARYDDAVDGVLELLRTRGSRREPPDGLGEVPRGLDLLLVEM